MTLELSLLPLPEPLRLMRGLCHCLVNSQAHTHLSLDYPTYLSVTLTCDCNTASDITLTVLMQANIWAELFICHFFLQQIFIEPCARCFRYWEMKSIALHSIFSPARWGKRNTNPFYIQCDAAIRRLIDVKHFWRVNLPILNCNALWPWNLTGTYPEDILTDIHSSQSKTFLTGVFVKTGSCTKSMCL